MFPCAQNSQGVALLCSIKVQIPAQEGEEEREACQEERRCHVSGLISVVSLPPSLPLSGAAGIQMRTRPTPGLEGLPSEFAAGASRWIWRSGRWVNRGAIGCH